MSALRAIPGINEVRGRGLMIGIDLPAENAEVRKRLLYDKGVFTGEAKPNVIRLLPSLALTQQEADHFLRAFKASL
jgi:acetylornithine aminotransferase